MNHEFVSGPDQDQPTPNIPMRQTVLPVRFSVGSLRLYSAGIPVLEATAHFLENPITTGDLWNEFSRHGGKKAVFGRSIPVAGNLAFSDQRPRGTIRELKKYDRHYVDLATTRDEYLAGFSSKSRSTLLRKMRKFETASKGPINWTSASRREEVASFLDEALPLSKRTYQHRLLNSGLPETAEFRSHLEALADDGKFRGWILRLDGKPVAYICGIGVGSSLLYEYVGFDADMGVLSPGTVLQLLVLEELFNDKSFRYFDFTEGSGAHKELFGNGSVQCADVLLAPDRLQLRMLLWFHAKFNRLERQLVGFTERAGIKSRLRKLVRGSG